MKRKTQELFGEQAGEPGAVPCPKRAPIPAAMARVLMPNRRQMEFRPSDLESLLAEGHRARIVWGYVERQDLSALYESIKSRDGGAGRAAIAPEILFALWLYATLESVGSARAIARFSQEHDAYRWICGGVQVNYHTVADFRVEHGEALDELLTVNLAGLMASGVLKLKRGAQDGMRVRASAGAGSFRREDKLKGYLEAAQQEVARLKRQIEDDPSGESRRRQAAQARAAREREQRIAAALARLPELAAIKKRQGKKAEDARASMTDAEATVMKMGDGGFRPAYNVQFGTDTESQIIIGVDVVTTGSDQGQMSPMVDQVIERCGKAPDEWLVDGGYPGHDEIDSVSPHTTVYAPVPKPKAKNTEATSAADNDNVDTDEVTVAKVADPYEPKPGDSVAVAAWRQRMSTDEAKSIYKERAATAECVNAQARNRGLTRLSVRGLAKTKSVALLFALAHNLMRMATLAPEFVGIGTGTSTLQEMAS